MRWFLLCAATVLMFGCSPSEQPKPQYPHSHNIVIYADDSTPSVIPANARNWSEGNQLSVKEPGTGSEIVVSATTFVYEPVAAPADKPLTPTHTVKLYQNGKLIRTLQATTRSWNIENMMGFTEATTGRDAVVGGTFVYEPIRENITPKTPRYQTHKMTVYNGEEVLLTLPASERCWSEGGQICFYDPETGQPVVISASTFVYEPVLPQEGTKSASTHSATLLSENNKPLRSFHSAGPRNWAQQGQLSFRDAETGRETVISGSFTYRPRSR
jgi:hypothetical protein